MVGAAAGRSFKSDNTTSLLKEESTVFVPPVVAGCVTPETGLKGLPVATVVVGGLGATGADGAAILRNANDGNWRCDSRVGGEAVGPRADILQSVT